MDQIKKRRSYYNLDKQVKISDERIEQILKDAVQYVPSAFNSGSSAAALLFDKNHHDFWEIVRETLRKRISEDKFDATSRRIDSFSKAYATILFFEDQSIVETLENDFPRYKENFQGWSLQSSGMLQYVVWTALESEGLGASLQHYNPIIDEEVKAKWNIPSNWKLISQMPLGNPVTDPEPKDLLDIKDRIKIFE